MKRSLVCAGSVFFALGLLGGCSGEPLPAAPSPSAAAGTPTKTVDPTAGGKATPKQINKVGMEP